MLILYPIRSYSPRRRQSPRRRMSPRRRSPPRRAPASSRHRPRRSPVRRLVYLFIFLYWHGFNILLHVVCGIQKTLSLFVSYRRRSRSASSSGSSSSGSRSPKKAVKRISTTPPRKQVHHPDTSISPTGKNRRSPSPRARRGRGSPSPPRSSGVLQFLLCTLY